jgi:hypothetical protein
MMNNNMPKFHCVLFAVLFLAISSSAAAQFDGQRQRAYMVKTITHIADPVLNALSKNQLKTQMPVEAKSASRKSVTYLEAFGRLFAGMAPWLELKPDNTAEGRLRKKYAQLVISCLKNATDPNAADFMNFDKGSQPLVDAAFLAQGLLRAPNQVWARLDANTKDNIIEALKSSRVIKPGNNNWLLFSAEVEAALLKYEGSCDRTRIDHALKSLNSWYKGDGAYGDGPNFHWDYYNSFVIQPMLLDIVQLLYEKDKTSDIEKLYGLILNRSKRYSAVQERLISPEGTYPPIGRSLAYRFGNFQLLSQIAWMQQLPENIEPEQVRCALYTVIKRQIEAPDTFDEKGWLRIGLYGHQPGIGEDYISTGSLYLCSEAFLVLGLPATNRFWMGPNKDWTAKKIWLGHDIPTDHAVD